MYGIIFYLLFLPSLLVGYRQPQLNSNQTAEFILYDLTGKLLNEFFVNTNQPFAYRHALPQSIYALKAKEGGAIRKIIVQP